MLLDFEKVLGAQLFVSAVKKQNKIILEEFLFIENSAVSNSLNDSFANQIILSFYKEKTT